MPEDYFRSTLWDDIERARKDDPKAREQLFRRYLPPVLRFLRKLGFNEHDGDDLAQEVFLRIVEKDVLEGADQRLGRFRSLLIGIIKNVIRDRAKHDGAKKRGGDKPLVSLDQRVGPGSTVLGETLPEREAAAFEQLWTFHLVRMAMERLRKECEAKELPYYEAFSSFLDDNLSHAEIAAQMKVTPAAVRNYIHRAKLRLLEYLRLEISYYARSDDELKAELSLTLQQIDGKG
jgi:RNA polymerase sigma-70 factor (ECF subfamily)